MNKETVKGTNQYAVFLFLLWPFFALILSIYSFRSNWAKNIVWLFVVFYGYTLVISNEGMDFSRYRDDFLEVVESDYEFSEFSATFYSSESNKLDIFQASINFLVSSFTDDFHILFAVFGLIFGFFYSRNIWYLLKMGNFEMNWRLAFLILGYTVTIGFWGIGGFRFFVATQIFVYLVTPFLLENKVKQLWFCILLPLIHFSYVLPVLVIIIYLIIGDNLNYIFYFFIISLFISELDFNKINEATNFLPDIFHSRTSMYVNEDYKINKYQNADNLNWYTTYYKKLLHYFFVFCYMFLFLKRKTYITNNWDLKRVFSFSLLFYGFSNIVSNIPSGGRFRTAAFMFSFTVIYLYINKFNKSDYKFNNMMLVLSPILLLFIIVSIRISFDTMSTFTVFTNPFITLFMQSNMPIIEFLK